MREETTKYQASSLATNLAISAGKDPAIVVVAGCDDVAEIGGVAMALADYYTEAGGRVSVVGCGRVPAQERAAFVNTPLINAEGTDVISFADASEEYDEIAASESFIGKVRDLAKERDRVIVVAPYAHKTVDASVVVRVADITALVAVPGKTRRKDFKKASEALNRSGANIAGITIVES